MNYRKNLPPKAPNSEQKKLPYQAPVLLVFGDIAMLTQGAIGTCQNDGAFCGSGGAANMMPN